MSQHIFTTEHDGRSIRVQIGFDRALQYVYMLVEDLDADEEKGELVYLYNNLDQPDPDALTLLDFQAALRHLGISVPKTMFIETQRDRAANTGNRTVTHTLDGMR